MKWVDIISPEAVFKAQCLAAAANMERDNGKIICPPRDQIFRAFELTPPDKVKVVIVGQDPYHTPGQANGLAFSIANGNPIQPSLRNIFKELVNDIGCPMPTTTDLTPWAEQGVLLLNASLTVEAHKANSHSGWGWDVFTGEIFAATAKLEQPVVYLAWGNFAHDIVYKCFPKATTNWKNMITEQHKACLFSSHPSPLSATRGNNPFIGSHCFSTANKWLKQMGTTEIDWSLN